MLEDNNKKLSVIHTPCKECVFAEYDHKRQTGCAAGMLDKFKNSGYDIVEVYDNEKEFFVINNKKCIFMRKINWLNNRGFNSLTKAVEEAKKENEIKYILILDINKNTSLYSIQNVINFFNKQEIIPTGILVITNTNEDLQIKIKDIAKLLDIQKIKWRIQKFIDQSLNFTQKIKAIIQSAPVNRFYFYIDPMKFDSNNLNMSVLNTKILDGLVFGCLKIGGGLFFSYLSWQYAKLNKNIDILLDSQYHTYYENIK
jgi:hypothetical protein